MTQGPRALRERTSRMMGRIPLCERTAHLDSGSGPEASAGRRIFVPAQCAGAVNSGRVSWCRSGPFESCPTVRVRSAAADGRSGAPGPAESRPGRIRVRARRSRLSAAYLPCGSTGGGSVIGIRVKEPEVAGSIPYFPRVGTGKCEVCRKDLSQPSQDRGIPLSASVWHCLSAAYRSHTICGPRLDWVI